MLAAYDKLPDCVSIHRVTGEALWVSKKALGLYCRTPEELHSSGLRKLLEQDGSFEFQRYLQQSVLEGREIVHEVHISTRQVNTNLRLRFAPLERCVSRTCQQLVMVVSRPSEAAMQISGDGRTIGPLAFTVSSKPVVLVDIIRSTIARHRGNYRSSFNLVISGEEAEIPVISVDPILLKMLLERLYADMCDTAGQGNRTNLQLTRMARTVRLRFSNTIPHYISVPDGGTEPIGKNGDRTEREDDSTAHQLAGLLGAKLRFSHTVGSDHQAELILPINAGIALPDPSAFGSDLVHIRKAANTNSAKNPIPRNCKTG